MRDTLIVAGVGVLLVVLVIVVTSRRSDDTPTPPPSTASTPLPTFTAQEQEALSCLRLTFLADSIEEERGVLSDRELMGELGRRTGQTPSEIVDWVARCVPMMQER